MRERIIEAARLVLGTVEFNPFQRGKDDVKAATTFGEIQGMTMPWPTVTTCWCEPSMLHGRTAYHVKVFLGHLGTRAFDTAIVMVKPHTAENWWRDLTRHPRCRRMCLTHANGPASQDYQWAVLLFCAGDSTDDALTAGRFHEQFDRPEIGTVWIKY